MSQAGQPLILLDRDGTIFVDTHYPRRPELVEFEPNAAAGLRVLRQKGYPLFVVSNQSGVGRGRITMLEFEAVDRRCRELLAAAGIEMAGFAYCLHGPDEGCRCRKPGTGLAPLALAGRPVDYARSFVAGDRESDLGLATALGATGCLVKTGKGAATWAAMTAAGTTGGIRYFADLLELATAVPAAD